MGREFQARNLKSPVTLPLYLKEDSDDEMPVATTKNSLRHKKLGKSTKTATKTASPPSFDITSEGDDDDDFAEGGNDSDQGKVLDSYVPSPEKISRKRKCPILQAASPVTSSENGIHELASKHLASLQVRCQIMIHILMGNP